MPGPASSASSAPTGPKKSIRRVPRAIGGRRAKAGDASAGRNGSTGSDVIVIFSLFDEPLPPLGNPGRITTPRRGGVRLFVELVDPGGRRYPVETVKKAVARHFVGATIFRSEGLYKRKWSPGVVVTILNHPPLPWRTFKRKVSGLVDHLLRRLRQDEILLEETPPDPRSLR